MQLAKIFQPINKLKRKSSIAGKTVVITGAGSGIGRETLLCFAEAGATVIAADINYRAAKRSAMLAEHFGVSATAYQVDVGNAEAMVNFATQIKKGVGPIDVVINNAGIGMSGNFLDTSDADWEKLLDVNLWSVIRGSRLFAKQMVATKTKGHIVNVASMAAFTPMREMSAYATSKAAVLMLSDCMRSELQQYDIQVSSICPGVVNTPITTSTHFVGVDSTEQTRRREAAKKLYTRRNLKPTAVAQAIFKAVSTGQAEVLVGTEAHTARWLTRLTPALARRLALIEPAI